MLKTRSSAIVRAITFDGSIVPAAFGIEARICAGIHWPEAIDVVALVSPLVPQMWSRCENAVTPEDNRGDDGFQMIYRCGRGASMLKMLRSVQADKNVSSVDLPPLVDFGRPVDFTHSFGENRERIKPRISFS